MAKYRKKPIVIEAIQFNLYAQVDDYPGIVIKDGKCVIETLEGDMIVNNGDWIITGVKGEKYPCKPDIFEATYEKVEE